METLSPEDCSNEKHTHCNTTLFTINVSGLRTYNTYACNTCSMIAKSYLRNLIYASSVGICHMSGHLLYVRIPLQKLTSTTHNLKLDRYIYTTIALISVSIFPSSATAKCLPNSANVPQNPYPRPSDARSPKVLVLHKPPSSRMNPGTTGQSSKTTMLPWPLTTSPACGILPSSCASGAKRRPTTKVRSMPRPSWSASRAFEGG
ncbi:hypothetical protein EDC01DRAFT_679452 [Geopyxis carbonaria]|nr:hypothetical protein EDC01DRAFT_679452 [Geopyxis carbonaria]